MKVVIDTSSLVALVRYYTRFDKGSKMFNFIRSKIEQGEIIVIDAVLKECEYQSQGIVLKTLNYLNKKDFKKNFKVPINTEFMTAPAPAKFTRQVDDNFTIKGAKRLENAEYEQHKNEFLKSADARMIIFALNEIHQNPDLDIRIVTEETEGSNNNKAFKKIPAICKILSIKCQALPELLDDFNGIDVEIK